MKVTSTLRNSGLFVVVLQNAERRLACFIFACLMVLSGIAANAQVPKMNIFSVVPEWHKKSVCADLSFDPGRITAPSISYSGANVQEPYYTYRWEQRKNNGPWEVKQSVEKAQFVSSFDPEVITTKEGQSKPDQYAWRLVVKDVANGNQEAISEIFELTVYPGIRAACEIIPHKSKPLMIAQLSVQGGLHEKIYKWKSLDTDMIIPDAATNQRKELPYGKYHIEISDQICPTWQQEINLAKPN